MGKPKWWKKSYEEMRSPLAKWEYLSGLSGLSWEDCQDAWFECKKLIPEVMEHIRRVENRNRDFEMREDLLKKENARLDKENCELRAALYDVMNQACGEWERAPWDSEKCKYVGEDKFKGFDSMCLSAYEGALSLLVEIGEIQKEHVLR